MRSLLHFFGRLRRRASWTARRLPALLAFVLALANFATPAGAFELVPAQAGYEGRSATVQTGGADISTADFVAAVMDGDSYPMSASYMGVDALQECRALERRGDGQVVVYQRTGASWPVKPRHYVIALRVTTQTDDLAVVEWDLVKHDRSGDSFSGPYASALNAHGDDAVYTPYNRGSWRYDRAAGTITYAATSDPGGSIPDFMVSQGAVMAFPLELLKVKWGVVP